MDLRAAVDAFIALLDEPRPYSIEWHNDVGPNDEGYWEWWEVAGIKFGNEATAQAFLEVLNAT